MRIGKGSFYLILGAALLLGGCRGSWNRAGEAEEGPVQEDAVGEAEEKVIGLLLSSRDAGENEAVTAAFTRMARAEGARLLVYTPDVSEEEAEEAAGLSYDSLVLCEADPIEYQMLGLNEFVAEAADVIALHGNHEEALSGVLEAARGVGIKVCAWDRELLEGSFDVYEKTAEEVAEAAAELVKK